MARFEIDGRTWETWGEPEKDLNEEQLLKARTFLSQEVAHVGHGCALDWLKDRRIGVILRIPDSETYFAFVAARAGVPHSWPPGASDRE